MMTNISSKKKIHILSNPKLFGLFEVVKLESVNTTLKIENNRKPNIERLFCFLIIIVALFTSVNSSFSQSPNLGSAEDFAIFTTVGALGNTGTSNISGNIGTGGGAISGFDSPTIVNGTIESNNPITTRCTNDLRAAYDEISTIPATVVDHAPVFGNGEVLFAGVYYIGSAGSLEGNLTLDAQNNTDEIFIFQFGGAFSAGATTSISLINGASPCNVFWVVEGAISMGAQSSMKGTFISNNGAVSMGDGGILEGRLLSTTGAANVYNTWISFPVCTNMPLSVSLMSYNSFCDEQTTVVQWRTSSETNNSHFTLERSLNGERWDNIGVVKGSGNSMSPHSYSFNDPVINSGTYYYRLKQTDFNGSYRYEGIITSIPCENSDSDRLTIYPNPNSGKFKLDFNDNADEVNTIDIFNSEGRKVLHTSGVQSIFDLSGFLPGVYIVQVEFFSKVKRMKFVLSN
ncbi:MAG: DUF3494 domain-containing protein [Bacteroidetes bacterium]|nr:DUF3494 domain-containing protein [Bacteroidota bacterium]